MKFVAPMPEQINTPTMHFSEVSRDPCYGSPETLVQCIVMVPICSGMGATNLKFWVLSRWTNSSIQDLECRVGLGCPFRTTFRS